MRRQREGLAELRQFLDYAEPRYLRDQLGLLASPLDLDEQQGRMSPTSKATWATGWTRSDGRFARGHGRGERCSDGVE